MEFNGRTVVFFLCSSSEQLKKLGKASTFLIGFKQDVAEASGAKEGFWGEWGEKEETCYTTRSDEEICPDFLYRDLSYAMKLLEKNSELSWFLALNAQKPCCHSAHRDSQP